MVPEKAKRRQFLIGAITVLLGVGCDAAPPQSRSPRIRVLGMVQDGGLPQPGCWCRNCREARRDLRKKHYISSLALVIPLSQGGQETYLIDATPDIQAQLDCLHDLQSSSLSGVQRRPVDGIILTHAHIGHYLGLAFFGFEAINARGMPVFCTPRMAKFLRENGPWSQLIKIENIALQEINPGKTFRLPRDPANPYHVAITPVQVSHRDEYSDTVGFLIRVEESAAPGKKGPALLYVSDTAPWGRWRSPLTELIDREAVTVAILDGTFYSPEELPDRNIAELGHPLMSDTMDLLEPMVRSGRLTVYFTHLNHSNPALQTMGPEYRSICKRGFHIAREGMEIPLQSYPPIHATDPSRECASPN